MYLVGVYDLTLDLLAGPVELQHLAQLVRPQQLHPLPVVIVLVRCVQRKKRGGDKGAQGAVSKELSGLST